VGDTLYDLFLCRHALRCGRWVLVAKGYSDDLVCPHCESPLDITVPVTRSQVRDLLFYPVADVLPDVPRG
jgi:hypothetical protein